MQADLSSAVERIRAFARLNERAPVIRARTTRFAAKGAADSDRDVRDLITARNLYVAK